jgi:hypothetical protein
MRLIETAVIHFRKGGNLGFPRLEFLHFPRRVLRRVEFQVGTIVVGKLDLIQALSNAVQKSGFL